tara:strand:+ start:152 stop:748 length:597 start_codon:yes stop_codon:yes gene_type:complete
MTFTDYIESETTKYKREWLNSIIFDIRQRIKSHLEGNMDKELLDELTLKQETIMNDSDTIERFMNGILKIDVLAQALYEPSTRNVPKDKFVIDYLKDKGVNLKIEKPTSKASTFGLHQSLKNIKCKGHKIELAVWSNKGNDAQVNNKFNKLSRDIYKTPTALIVDGPKVKQRHLDTLKRKRNLNVMNIEEFIEWSKIN